ncbi:hypothetical protein PPL_01813 [Heterostelium album PN500]|uniref:Uncharacterized protein n=1 Tax=Heterostelium pallidum (strain ATCC 26659 / Pp 5 / PN500) TaxID=670386 RepID=D3B0J6_HETP5|nr:hypothetical protein PPL_01813 [Heterostelium album PN500]EFA84820.1 hypothetical protein PPL_01813 [Heterostelium album PN500]|eukprot:XP_020436931.1 hypothetical protein PPL_01813 [Heterostelium album PN500]
MLHSNKLINIEVRRLVSVTNESNTLQLVTATDICLPGQSICETRLGPTCYSKTISECIDNIVCSIGQGRCPADPDRDCFDPRVQKCQNGRIVPINTPVRCIAPENPCGMLIIMMNYNEIEFKNFDTIVFLNHVVGCLSQGVCDIAGVHYEICNTKLGIECYSPNIHECIDGIVCSKGQGRCPDDPRQSCFDPRYFKCQGGRIVDINTPAICTFGLLPCGNICFNPNLGYCNSGLYCAWGQYICNQGVRRCYNPLTEFCHG